MKFLHFYGIKKLFRTNKNYFGKPAKQNNVNQQYKFTTKPTTQETEYIPVIKQKEHTKILARVHIKVEIRLY